MTHKGLFETRIWAISLAGLVVAGPRSVIGAVYTVTDLGTLPDGSYAEARGINDSGQVVGWSHTSASAGPYHAFLWQSGIMTDLGTLGGIHSYANDINGAGRVVGQADTADGPYHAFLWEGGVMQDLGTLGGSYSEANGINDSGQVVGNSHTASGYVHAFLWSGGLMDDLGGSNSTAYDINDAAQIVGVSSFRAFLWESGVMQDLGTLGGSRSWAFGINNAARVVGMAQTVSGDYHAFLYDDGTMQDLGTLGGNHSRAYGINDFDQVVARTGLGAFLYDSTNGMQNLNELVLPTDSGWVLANAYDINSIGQIVGYGTVGGETHAFLLTPIPEPGDYDGDGDVDLDDFANWGSCMTGPDAGPYDPRCEPFDFDFDGDVDLLDFAGFQAAFNGALPPVTDVLLVDNGIFVDAPLPEPSGSADAPAMEPPEILAWEDQGFFLSPGEIGDTPVAQVAMALDGYHGHILLDVVPDKCDRDIILHFMVRVTSGRFNLRMVPIAEDGLVGDVGADEFEVLMRGFTFAQRESVERGDDAVIAYVLGLALCGMGSRTQEQMAEGDLDEIIVEGCPRFVAQRNGDATTFLWDWGTGCVQEGVGLVSGAVTGTGSIADQSVNLTLDYVAGCTPLTGSAEGSFVGVGEPRPPFGTSVNITAGSITTTAEGTWVSSGEFDDPIITLIDVTGSVADAEEGIEGAINYENLVVEGLAAGNFTPSSGTVMFTITSAPDTGSVVVVRYTLDTPETRVVLVSVDGGPEFEFMLD